MLYYEIKKVFAKTGSRLALLILAAVLAVTCWFAVWGRYFVNEQGEKEYGIAAAQKLREAKLAWEGPLTEEKIAEVLQENARIVSSEEYQSADVKKKEIAYGWTQGFSDIRSLIVSAFCAFRDYDYYIVNSLSTEDAQYFYGNRTRNLKEWLDGEAKDIYTEEEKAYLIGQYEALEAPWYYTDVDGWRQLFEYAPTIIMLMTMVLGFLTAGIFSGEYAQKADAVFFSSFHGQKRAVKVKIEAGFLIVTGIYWIVWLLYTAIVLGALGNGGADCAIQLYTWKSFYNFTIRQVYWLTAIGGYVGCLFMMFLTMFVSAAARSSVVAVVVPFALVFLPSFLSGTGRVLNEVIGLLPDQLLQMNRAMGFFNLYHVGGRIMGAAGILPVLYGTLTLLLAPAVYWVYRRRPGK